MQPQTSPSAKLSSNSAAVSFSFSVPLHLMQTNKFTSLFSISSLAGNSFWHTKHFLSFTFINCLIFSKNSQYLCIGFNLEVI